MNRDALVDRVLQGFKREHGCIFYSHSLPFRYANDIDNLYQLSMLAGAMDRAYTLRPKRSGLEYMLTHNVREHLLLLEYHSVRCVAPYQVRDSWVQLDDDLWGHPKPQATAGPLAHAWVINKRYWKADLLCAVCPLIVYLLRYKPLKQHLNTFMLAHFVTHKVPPKSLLWVTEDNPVYSYLYGIKCTASYPNTGPWPAKDIPFSRKEDTSEFYTPVCELTGCYLQELL